MSKLPVGSKFGNYQIVRHIGGGGMAQIYLAKTSGLAGFEKHLALKVINPEYANEERFVQMLIDEAKITVGLSHVNIAQVFDLGQFDGIYYIAMEFVDGLDVLELVNGLHTMRQRVPVEAAAYITRQICGGLHYAHTRKGHDGTPLNIVHRDISPQNILVSRAGEVKVVDFGIAKAAGVSSKTQAGVIKGKVNYMAPEQVMGQKADRRTDIFSVGIVLWEMLTSQMVYSAENMGELVAAVRKADIARPASVRPEIPQQLDAIVMRALHSDPLQRFQNAHELQVELTKFLSANAPDYSGTNLSRLVEQVLSGKSAPEGTSEIDSRMSRGDNLSDHHSLIFSAELRARLVITQGNASHQAIDLEDELTIGRAGQLTLADARVSRQHARIRRSGQDFLVEDLGSSNGTYVNDHRLTAAHPLRDGDIVRIGGCLLRFELNAHANAVAPEPRPMLLVDVDGQEHEHDIEGDVELTYRLQLGPLVLSGSSGRLTRKEDGFWLEPVDTSRVSMTISGQPIDQPHRLSVGDRFAVGDTAFTLTERS